MNLIGWAKTHSMSADNDGTLGKAPNLTVLIGKNYNCNLAQMLEGFIL